MPIFFHHKILPALLTLAIASTAQAATYSNVFVFGDSLSDGGIFYGARNTTNPGLTAAEYFAQSEGYTLTTSTTGGTNYAQGGARVTSASTAIAPGYAQRPISTQVDEYLTSTGGKADAHAVYFIQGGPNDVFQNLEKLAAGSITTAQLQTNLTTAGTELAAQINRLRAAGAQHIVMSNVPNIGATPAFSGATSAMGTAAAQTVNTATQAALTASNTDVVALDLYKLIGEVVASPSTYGFTNATTPACTVAVSLLCSPATLVDANAPNTYVFADGVHPTTGMHKLAAQYFSSVFNAPAQVSVLSAAPLSGSTARLNRLDKNVAQAGNQKWHVFADIDQTRAQFDDAKSTNNNLLVGADHAVGKGRLGASFGYQRYSGSFGNNTGGFTMTEPSVGVYYNQEGKFGRVLASASYGQIGFSKLDRSIALGANTRTESADTKGSHWALGVKTDIVAGQAMKGKIKHGPVLGLRYEAIKINGYSEAGDSSTAMVFGGQTRKGWLADVGYQVQGDFNRIKPYAKISYEHNATRGSNVRAHVKSMYSNFETSSLKVDDGFRAELGTHISVSPRAQLNLGLASTLGKKSGKETALSLGFNAQF